MVVVGCIAFFACFLFFCCPALFAQPHESLHTLHTILYHTAPICTIPYHTIAFLQAHRARCRVPGIVVCAVITAATVPDGHGALQGPVCRGRAQARRRKDGHARHAQRRTPRYSQSGAVGDSMMIVDRSMDGRMRG